MVREGTHHGCEKNYLGDINRLMVREGTHHGCYLGE
jgi:hypothetical protein